jgi:hypothetical protein
VSVLDIVGGAGVFFLGFGGLIMAEVALAMFKGSADRE